MVCEFLNPLSCYSILPSLAVRMGSQNACRKPLTEALCGWKLCVELSGEIVLPVTASLMPAQSMEAGVEDDSRYNNSVQCVLPVANAQLAWLAWLFDEQMTLSMCCLFSPHLLLVVDHWP